MKITAKKNFCLKGVHVGAGDTVETDARTARDLINMGRAMEAVEIEKTDPPPKKPAAKAGKGKKKPAPPPVESDDTNDAYPAE